MDKKMKPLALLTAGCLTLSTLLPSLGTLEAFAAPKSDDTITLRAFIRREVFWERSSAA